MELEVPTIGPHKVDVPNLVTYLLGHLHLSGMWFGTMCSNYGNHSRFNMNSERNGEGGRGPI